MIGEYASATLHFYKSGIFIECKELDIGEFIPKGNGNMLMSVLNDIEDCTNPEAKYIITEKGKELLKELNKK